MDNEELVRALRESPDKTLMQRYAPNLRQYMPDMLANYLAEALKYPMMPGFKGAMSPTGLTPQDFAIARQVERNLPTATHLDDLYVASQVPIDPGITGGQPSLNALQRQATLDMGYGPNLHKDFAPRRGMLRDDPEYRYSSQGMMDRKGMQSSQNGFLGRRGTADPGYEQAVAERAAMNELLRGRKPGND